MSQRETEHYQATKSALDHQLGNLVSDLETQLEEAQTQCHMLQDQLVRERCTGKQLEGEVKRIRVRLEENEVEHQGQKESLKH